MDTIRYDNIDIRILCHGDPSGKQYGLSWHSQVTTAKRLLCCAVDLISTVVSTRSSRWFIHTCGKKPLECSYDEKWDTNKYQVYVYVWRFFHSSWFCSARMDFKESILLWHDGPKHFHPEYRHELASAQLAVWRTGLLRRPHDWWTKGRSPDVVCDKGTLLRL